MKNKSPSYACPPVPFLQFLNAYASINTFSHYFCTILREFYALFFQLTVYFGDHCISSHRPISFFKELQQYSVVCLS